MLDNTCCSDVKGILLYNEPLFDFICQICMENFRGQLTAEKSYEPYVPVVQYRIKSCI